MIESTYPMLRCANSEEIIAKNSAFETLAKIRLGTKLETLMHTSAADIKFRLGGSQKLFVLPCGDIKGVCGVCVIPNEDVFDIIFLPEYFKEIIGSDSERALFEQIYSSADAFCCEAEKSELLQKIKSCVVSSLFEKAALAPSTVSVGKAAEELVKFIGQRTAAYGMRISVDVAQSSSRACLNPKFFAAELLCMLDIAVTASTDGKLRFFTEENFGRITVGFSANIGKSPAANFSPVSRYMFMRVANSAGHEPLFTYSGCTFSAVIALASDTQGQLNSGDGCEAAFVADAMQYLPEL